VAAVLVLAAMAMGREAVTLRLVATGALAVMLVLPEAVAGASFQLSFAAIVAIVALHEHPAPKRWFGPHEEAWPWRSLRGLGSLLLTGVVVELTLLPIAAYHFHRAGLYGSVANIVAIPLTTFVVMPAEALALVLDGVGLGWPAWWVAGRALELLLWLAHAVAGAPGAVAALPVMPTGAFAAMMLGGLWVALWRTPMRWAGLVAVAAGFLWTLVTPGPDLLVTGDGRHVAMRLPGGRLAMLRDRAGDYVQDMLAENGGVDGAPLLLAEQREARCNRDVCVAEVAAGGRSWRVAATRSSYMMPVEEVVATCRAADVVVSERRLPRTCRPRWLKLDRPALEASGGVAVTFGVGTVRTVRRAGDRHPWREAKVTKVTPARGTRDPRRGSPSHRIRSRVTGSRLEGSH
jgi:competence protein ComEC